MTTKIETTVAALIEAADNDNNEAAKVAAAKLASGALNDIRRIADALESIAEILLPKPAESGLAKTAKTAICAPPNR